MNSRRIQREREREREARVVIEHVMTVFITSYVLLDTPGQIEVFTWSASGSIIAEALAATFPTVLVYVMDTPRCASPQTFMSNMLYACR